jgi:hypothetical protein
MLSRHRFVEDHNILTVFYTIMDTTLAIFAPVPGEMKWDQQDEEKLRIVSMLESM